MEIYRSFTCHTVRLEKDNADQNAFFRNRTNRIKKYQEQQEAYEKRKEKQNSDD